MQLYPVTFSLAKPCTTHRLIFFLVIEMVLEETCLPLGVCLLVFFMMQLYYYAFWRFDPRFSLSFRFRSLRFFLLPFCCCRSFPVRMPHHLLDRNILFTLRWTDFESSSCCELISEIRMENCGGTEFCLLFH